jgi:hypothetical protein
MLGCGLPLQVNLTHLKVANRRDLRRPQAVSNQFRKAAQLGPKR